MKFKTDHTHHEPIFSALATILDNDYEILYDSSDNALGLSATVVHKKYKSHGFHISTYLNERPDWTVTTFIDLPLDNILNPKLTRFTFQPTYKDGYPYLTNTQINDISIKLAKMETTTLNIIMDSLAIIDNIQMSGSSINSYYQNGFKVLENFKNYGVKVDFKNFLLNTNVNTLMLFRIIQGIYISPIPEIKILLSDAIEAYIDIMITSNLDAACSMANRFLSVSKENIATAFTEYNMSHYMEMIESHILLMTGSDNIDLIIKSIITFRRAIDSNSNLEDRINFWAFSYTGDDYFLPQTAKDIFLF